MRGTFKSNSNTYEKLQTTRAKCSSKWKEKSKNLPVSQMAL